MKYVCDACGWIYDEEKGDADLGIAPGTKFEDLPEDFECPLCGVGKDMFIAQEQFLKVRTIRSDFLSKKLRFQSLRHTIFGFFYILLIFSYLLVQLQ